MKYRELTSIESLKENYDLLIGWGTGIEFRTYYHVEDYKVDYLIDGLGNRIGEEVCGIKVDSIDLLKKLQNKKICFIIFCNRESEVCEQIEECIEADIIISSLVKINNIPLSYAKNSEDVIMFNLVRKLKLKDISFMDIGVCHPIMRNNTYLFNLIQYKKGVLVEPNPEFHKLIEFYRPSDTLLKCGATAGDDAALTYYSFRSSPGSNTFSEKIAKGRSEKYMISKIPVININKLIYENFDKYPNILDIDVEGLDYEIINSIDFKKYKIEIICCESNNSDDFHQLLISKGYRFYASTIENTIYLREDLNIQFI